MEKGDKIIDLRLDEILRCKMDEKRDEIMDFGLDEILRCKRKKIIF